ncbi:MAG: glycosyltransferase [Patescibacteria group bacterium]
MTIWANTIVNNEENFIWFAIMSVLDYVDKILVWDTGSTDKTVEVIKTINSNKLKFKEVGKVDPMEFTKMRQKMLEESKCDWILILDGDEIWWEKSIKMVVSETNKRGNIDAVVVPMVVPVGDIYHMQDQSAGKYKLLGKTGHLSLKAFSKKIPGLHVDWPYGKEGFFDGSGKLIQERERIIFVDAPFLHVTHLRRSSVKRKYDKFKYELGEKVDKSFKFPEVLYRSYPNSVASPWNKMSGDELIKSQILTPLRKFKRRILN